MALDVEAAARADSTGNHQVTRLIRAAWAVAICPAAALLVPAGAGA